MSDDCCMPEDDMEEDLQDFSDELLPEPTWLLNRVERKKERLRERFVFILLEQGHSPDSIYSMGKDIDMVIDLIVGE